MSNYFIYSGRTLENVNLYSDDTMYVYSGGLAVGTEVNSNGVMRVLSDGKADCTEINNGGSAVIVGGSALGTTVNQAGKLAFSGGTVRNTTVQNGGSFAMADGSAIGGTVCGTMQVSGGYVSDIAVTDGGVVTIFQQTNEGEDTLKGVRLTASSCGTIILSAGELDDLKVDNGVVQILDGKVYGADVTNNGSMTTISGGIIDDLSVEKGGSAFIEGTLSTAVVGNGGTLHIGENITSADGITVEDNGTLLLQGAAANTVIKSGGFVQCLNEAGILNRATVLSGGSVCLAFGDGDTAQAVDVTVSNGGRMDIFSSGCAEGTVVKNGGEIHLYNAIITDTTIESGGKMIVEGKAAPSASVAIKSTNVVKNGGFMQIGSTGQLTSAIMEANATLVVEAGGSAASLELENGVILDVTADGKTSVTGFYNASDFAIGATTSDFNIVSGITLTLKEGATATNCTVAAGGVMNFMGGNADHIEAAKDACLNFELTSSTKVSGTSNGSAFNVENGTLDGWLVKDGGFLIVKEGGSATNAEMNSGAYLGIESGAYVSGAQLQNDVGVDMYVGENTYVQFTSAGCSVEEKDGVLSGWRTSSGRETTVGSGGILSDYAVQNGGTMAVLSGGTVSSGTVAGGAVADVATDAEVKDIAIKAGATVTLHKGASIDGIVRIENGAAVSADQGVNLNLSVAEQKNPTVVLVQGWDSVVGKEDVNYTITVNVGQAEGTYALMSNADSFRQTITVSTTDDTVLGTLSLRQSKKFDDGNYYMLDVNDNNELFLTISAEDPKQKKTAISDYNGSGKSDMVQFVDGLVYVTHDTSSGYVQTPAINDITGWNVAEIRRDLTGDGYADIQITSYDGAESTWVATLRNDYLETGSITLNYQFIGAYATDLWSYLGSADFNGDGKAEILMIQTEAGKDQYGHRNVAAWVTDSESCQWVDNIWLGALNDGWDVAGTADVTGDGKDNLILRRADGMIGYWDNFGGSPEDVVLLKNAGDRVLITTGDFNGDGLEDFLWKSTYDDEMSVWSDLNGDMTDIAIGRVSSLSGSWTFAGAGDYNGDGKDEILWCDSSANKLAYSEANKENFANLVSI